MINSLSQSIDKVSEIDKKISYAPLIEKFLNTYQLCLNEYMDSWERFNEASLPDKESFYSELNKEDITDGEYAHARKVWKVFKIKNLGEYHDLYVQSDTALLAFFFFFFFLLSGFSFTNVHDSQDSRGRGRVSI